MLLLIGLLPCRAADPPLYPERRDLLYYLDPAGRKQPVRTPANWARRVAHVKASMELAMGRLPKLEKQPPRLVVIEETRLAHYTRRKVTYTAERDDSVSAYLLVPHGPPGRRPAAICLPGSSEPGKAVPAGLEGNPNLAYGHELAERGYVALIIDYPMLHRRDYKTDPYEMGYSSATMKGIVNHRRGVDLLASLPYVDPQRIAVIGHSLGGHNALFLAVFEPRIRAVVSSCGFNVFAKHAGGDVSAWSQKYYMPLIRTKYGNDPARIPFDFTEVLAALAPRPVFINAPLHDAPDFEVSGVRDCVDAALPVYSRVFHAADRLVPVYPDAGHDFPPEVRRQAYDFLDRWLR